MYILRPADQRGHTLTDWLDSYHSFSFGDYYDPRFMGFGALRVINDDVIAPGRGFGAHPHNDMEIVTIILSGALEHKDSIGSGSVIRRDEVQVMSAGSGIWHSEFNPSAREPVHLLQIWIIPDMQGLKPAYEQRKFSEQKLHNRLGLIVSPDAAEESLQIHQNVLLYRSYLDAEAKIEFEMQPGRRYWLQVATGSVAVNDRPLIAGDGLGIAEEKGLLDIRGIDSQSDFLLFDMPGQA